MPKTILVFHSNGDMANLLCAALYQNGYLPYDPISTLTDAYRHIARGQIDMAILDEAMEPQSVSLLSDALSLIDIEHVVINSMTYETRYHTGDFAGETTEKHSDNFSQNACLISTMWQIHMGRIYSDMLGMAVA